MMGTDLEGDSLATQDGWGLPFAIDSKPGVSANNDLAEVLDIAWPTDN